MEYKDLVTEQGEQGQHPVSAQSGFPSGVRAHGAAGGFACRQSWSVDHVLCLGRIFCAGSSCGSAKFLAA